MTEMTQELGPVSEAVVTDSVRITPQERDEVGASSCVSTTRHFGSPLVRASGWWCRVRIQWAISFICDAIRSPVVIGTAAAMRSSWSS